jgi:hypothetical protein
MLDSEAIGKRWLLILPGPSRRDKDQFPPGSFYYPPNEDERVRQSKYKGYRRDEFHSYWLSKMGDLQQELNDDILFVRDDRG